MEKPLAGHAKNGYGHSFQATLKLAVSQEWIDRVNYFLHA